jgi:PLP dependent protein
VIIDNLRQIRYRMRAAAERVGRRPDAVSLLAVTKYAPLDAVKELLTSGDVAEAAENRVQDAQQRKRELGPLAEKVRWRLIGHLQTNKAKAAVETFDAVDSVDSVHCARALDKRLEAAAKTMPVLLQIKLTAKETQSGLPPEQLERTLAEIEKTCPTLSVRGLMGIAPDVERAEEARGAFKTLKGLFDRHFAGRPGAQLSMGMSRDFEVAIEEGSTMVRIGSALFSPDESEASLKSNKGGQ